MNRQPVGNSDRFAWRIKMAETTVGNFKISYRENSADEGVLKLYSFENDIYFKKVPEYHPKADHIIIDVGAHIGTFSVLAASRVPCGKVFAIEACQDTFNYLKKNAEQNGFGNIIPARLALCDKPGTIRLYHDLEEGNWGNTIVKKVSDTFEDCPADTLERFLKSRDIERCHFLKINCEGAEFGIILSTPQQTLRKIKVFHISYHSDLAEGCSENDLMKHLQGAGFYVRKVLTGEKRGWLIAIRAGLLLRLVYTLRDGIRFIIARVCRTRVCRALEWRLFKPLLNKFKELTKGNS
jgi:FkbM family methyltransferase